MNTPRQAKLIDQRAREIFAKGEKDLTCTCYWPATGAPCHSPDCAVEQAWVAAFDQAEDELFEEGRLDDDNE
jgi:hypothetical protein